MGKTSLVAQVARRAHGEGAVVLFGHADEDLGVAYQPWIEVARRVWSATAIRSALAGLRSAQRGALARLVPEIGADGDRVGGSGHGTAAAAGRRDRAARGRVAARAPVLVVLDDLHWADTASLQLLRHVIALDDADERDDRVHVSRHRPRPRRSAQQAAGRPAPRGQRHPDRARRASKTTSSSSCWPRRPVTTSTTTASASRTRCGARPTATRSSPARSSATSARSGGIVLGDDGRWIARRRARRARPAEQRPRRGRPARRTPRRRSAARAVPRGGDRPRVRPRPARRAGRRRRGPAARPAWTRRSAPRCSSRAAPPTATGSRTR